MKSYSYSEARGNFATVLDEAERDGAVEIRRRDGTVFRILPLRSGAEGGQIFAARKVIVLAGAPYGRTPPR